MLLWMQYVVLPNHGNSILQYSCDRGHRYASRALQCYIRRDIKIGEFSNTVMCSYSVRLYDMSYEIIEQSI